MRKCEPRAEALDEQVEGGAAGAGEEVKVEIEKDAQEAAQTENAGEGLGAAEEVGALRGAGAVEGLSDGLARELHKEFGDLPVEREGEGLGQAARAVVAAEVPLFDGEGGVRGRGAARAGGEVRRHAQVQQQVALQPQEQQGHLARCILSRGLRKQSNKSRKGRSLEIPRGVFAERMQGMCRGSAEGVHFVVEAEEDPSGAVDGPGVSKGFIA